jgi:hypothetical protein
MWLVYEDATGAEIRRETSEPQLSAGEAAVRVPGSAMGEPPLSVWSAPHRGFIDVPLADGPAMLRLLTAAEIQAMCSNPATIPIALNWLVLVVGGRPQRVNSPLHIAAANAMRDAGVLTLPRHAEFVAGAPPSSGF